MAFLKIVIQSATTYNELEPSSSGHPSNEKCVFLYEDVSSLILNGDGAGTTDFINAQDGLAQYWGLQGAP